MDSFLSGVAASVLSWMLISAIGVVVGAIWLFIRTKRKAHLQKNVYRKWRVKPEELIAQVGISTGSSGAWEINLSTSKAQGIYGPYLGSLKRGAYCATFRLKISNRIGLYDRIAELDVISHYLNGDKQKYLAHRSLYVRDFRAEERYQLFNLYFYVIEEEERVEFRMLDTQDTRGQDRLLTLDYVELQPVIVIQGWKWF